MDVTKQPGGIHAGRAVSGVGQGLALPCCDDVRCLAAQHSGVCKAAPSSITCYCQIYPLSAFGR